MNKQATALSNPGVVRAGLAALGVVQLVDGLYALLAPHSFYEEFPLGRGWVAMLPSYNEHLVRDVGGLFIATAVMLLAAAIYMERRLITVALVSFLAFTVPHAIFHVFHLDNMGTFDAVGNAVSVVAIAVIPLGLLWAMSRPAAAKPTRAAAPPAGGEARIPLVTGSLNPIVASSFLSSKLMFGGTVPNSVRITAHHPALLAGYGMLELATKFSHRAPARLKHLAELRAASLCGCEWCMDFGSSISEEAGVDEGDLVALPNYESTDHFSELEKLVLDYATGMSRTPVEVPDELFAKLAEHLDEAQLVELTSAIAIENYRARSLWAFGLESQGYAENMTCVRPAEVPASA